MSKNIMIGVVVVIVVVLGGWWYMKGMSTTPYTAAPTPAPMETMAPATGSATVGAVKEITVTGSGFKFDPATLTINKGDHVKLTFVNSGGQHDFVIDELGVKTPVINSGQTSVVEFMADRAGTFEYYCSVGNHRAMGMKGTLTVQ